MNRLAKDTKQIIRQDWKWVMLFEILYRGITLPAYLYLIKQGLRLALKVAGYSYLTAGNVGRFLIQPGTVVFLLVVGIVGITILVLEIASLLTAFQGSVHHGKLTPFLILWGGVQKTLDLVKNGKWQVGMILMFQYVLANLFFLYRALSHVKPVNFVMQEIVNKPVALFLLAMVFTAAMVTAIKFIYIAHTTMIEQKNFVSSIKRGQEILNGNRTKIVMLVIWANLLVIFFIAALYFLLVLVTAIFVIQFTEQNLAMAILLSVTDKLELGLLFLGSILTLIANYGVISASYYLYGNRRTLPESWEKPEHENSKGKRRKIIAALCVIMGMSLFYIFDQVKHGAAMTDEILIETQIVAHRGSSKSAPENTLSAMQSAIDELADAVELDVQMTSDGVIVLGHDATLKRVAGVNRSIGSLTYDEIKELDVGSWFSQEFAGERIPTLEEVLDLCNGKISLNIEIKNVGKDSSLPDEVVKLLLEKEMEEQCVITSTSLSYLKRVKEIKPQLRTGYIISAAYGDFYSSEAIDFISLRSGFVNEALMENVHGQGKAVMAWTVNAKSEMERLTMLGVDGIITDKPVLAREIVYREEATENLFEYLRMVFR